MLGWFSFVFTTLKIWDAVDDKKGYLTRTGLYKALALTALAQQGKPLNDKILESFTDTGIESVCESAFKEFFVYSILTNQSEIHWTIFADF